MDQRPQGNVPYYPPPPPPGQPQPPPLPPRHHPSDAGGYRGSAQRPPALPARPSSGSFRSWGSSLAKNVSSNIKTLAREGAQAASSSPYFKQLTGGHQSQQPEQHQHQPQHQHQAGYQQSYYQGYSHQQVPQQPGYQYHQPPPIPQPPPAQTHYPGQHGYTVHGAPQATPVPPAETGPTQSSPPVPSPGGRADEYHQPPVTQYQPSLTPKASPGYEPPPQATQYVYLGPADTVHDNTSPPQEPRPRPSGTAVKRKDVPSPVSPQHAAPSPVQPPVVTQPPSERLQLTDYETPTATGEAVSPPLDGAQDHVIRADAAPETQYHYPRTVDPPVERYAYPIEPREQYSSAVPDSAAPSSRPDTTSSTPMVTAPQSQPQQQGYQPVSYPLTQPVPPAHPNQIQPQQYAPPIPPPSTRPPISDGQPVADSRQSLQGPPAAGQSGNDAVSGLLSNIMSGFQGLSVESVPSLIAQRDQKWVEDDWARPPLSFNPDGTPNDVVWDCPGAGGDSPYKARWYHHPEVPGFLICTRCYDRFIARTRLSGAFKKSEPAIGRCRFNVPRITVALLPQCKASGDVEPLVSYFRRRLSIQDCKGANATTGKDQTKWFVINRETNEICVNYVSCEACYEDVLKSNPSYGSEFVPRDQKFPGRPQGEKDVWTCDTSFGFVARCFGVYSRNGMPFMDWVDRITKRFKLPRCEGQAVESSSREWVRPKDNVEGLIICEECFQDKIAWTAIEADFEFMSIPKPISNSERMDYVFGHRSDPPTAWVCDAKNDAIISALESSIKRQDIRLFVKASRTIMASPACAAQGIANGKWYTLSGGAEEFDVCAAHFAGYFEAWGQDGFLQPAKSTGSPNLYLCNLNPNTGRYLQFMHKLYEAGQEGVWSRYEDAVRKYATIPECARREHVPNRRWYGWLDCLICPDCFEAVNEGVQGPESILQDGSTRGLGQAAQTPAAAPKHGLVQTMDVHNEIIEEIRMCCMYSPRMRQKYAEAAALNDPSKLLEFSRERHAVYARTVPNIKMLRGIQDMQMMSAMTAGMASLMHQGAGNIQSIAGATDGHLHGNSQIGWYDTENGATSAKLFNEMNAGFAAAGAGGPWMQIFHLTAEWEKWE